MILRSFRRLALPAVAALALTACEGADGAAGALGPQGPQGQPGGSGPPGTDGEDGNTGPQGPPGQDGTDGQDGEDGNVNVRSFTFTYEDTNCLNNISFAACIRSWDALTQRVFDEGAVLSYRRDGDAWVSLPFSQGLDLNGDGLLDNTVEFLPGFRVGQYELQIRFGSGSITA